MDAIVAAWAEESSERLGRPAAEIRARGLGAQDFHPLEEVAVAIFPEHCGYWGIPSWGLEVTRVRREPYYGEGHE